MSEFSPHDFKLVNEFNPQNLDRNLLAIALMGGGTVAIARQMAALEILEEAGVPVSTAEIIGTSGGGWSGALISKKKRFTDIEGIKQIRVPNYKRGYLKGIAEEIFQDDNAPNLRVMGTEIPTLCPVKVPGTEVDIATQMAISSAVPGFFFPGELPRKSRIIPFNRFLVDGGVRSLTSAHYAPRAENLLTIGVLHPEFEMQVGLWSMKKTFKAGRLTTRGLEKEMDTWTEKHGGESEHVYVEEEFSQYIKGIMSFFDFELAKDMYWSAKEDNNKKAFLERHKDFIAKFATPNTTGLPEASGQR